MESYVGEAVGLYLRHVDTLAFLVLAASFLLHVARNFQKWRRAADENGSAPIGEVADAGLHALERGLIPYAIAIIGAALAPKTFGAWYSAHGGHMQTIFFFTGLLATVILALRRHR